MSIIHWKPFRELDRTFENLPNFSSESWDLAANIYEQDNNIIVEMHVPGINPDKINIDVEDNHLHIAGSREIKEEEKNKQYYHKEIRYGSFERVLPLPAHVIAKETQAEIKDGVLKIVLPKSNTREAQKIQITKK